MKKTTIIIALALPALFASCEGSFHDPGANGMIGAGVGGGGFGGGWDGWGEDSDGGSSGG